MHIHSSNGFKDMYMWKKEVICPELGTVKGDDGKMMQYVLVSACLICHIGIY